MKIDLSSISSRFSTVLSTAKIPFRMKAELV